MSTLDRTSDKPVLCRYDTATISKEVSNRHYPVMLSIGSDNDEYDHPTVLLQVSVAENQRVWGELGAVYEDTGLCQVYRKGLLYFRAKEAYDDANDGKPVSYSDSHHELKPIDLSTPSIALLSGAIDAPIQEGGFEITELDEDGNDDTIYILKCRR